MKKKITYSITSFFVILSVHFAYSIWQTVETANKWKQIKEINPFLQYFERQDFFLGLSYALTAAFTAYAVTNFLQKRKNGIAGTVGGFTLAGLLYFAGCFLTGCCGSPMLAVYLSLFGSSIIGFAKPITAGLTAVSVMFGFVWINRKSKTKVCSSNDVCCEVSEEKNNGKFIMKNENKNIIDIELANQINSEMNEGINLLKCQQCGCMKETLEILKSEFPSKVDNWEKKMIPIKYSCLGCAHCYPAVAMNLFNEAFPEKVNTQLDCAFEVKEDKWPYVAGEYYAFCGGDYCPVAVSTLGDTELAERLAKNHPDELCIVGKTETENIGVDKVIKNVITNPTIKYLLLVGQEPKGHKSGETFFSLSKNGVDDKMRVIGSTAKKPILRNVSVEEINSFINQVEVVNMIGYSDDNLIINEIKKLLYSNETEKAKSLYYSELFDEQWKNIFLSNLGGVLESLVINDRKKEEYRKIKKMKMRHQEFLNSLGVNYLGIMPTDIAVKHRVTHCYNCKENLDNNINIECNACHWIICECGACGCGYG